RRGELFRKVGVQDLASYRQAVKGSGAQGSGTNANSNSSLTPDPSPLTPGNVPRTLLVIDEFQEFFSEDDKLAQDSAVLLDRLVRQGRAFGIHVLLGSQT